METLYKISQAIIRQIPWKKITQLNDIEKFKALLKVCKKLTIGLILINHHIVHYMCRKVIYRQFNFEHYIICVER